MAWRRPGDKPLSEPMMAILLTHICVTRSQWVNKSIQLSTAILYISAFSIASLLIASKISFSSICMPIAFKHVCTEWTRQWPSPCDRISLWLFQKCHFLKFYSLYSVRSSYMGLPYPWICTRVWNMWSIIFAYWWVCTCKSNQIISGVFFSSNLTTTVIRARTICECCLYRCSNTS